MNIYLDSVGCRLNQSEIENYARHFRTAGHNLVADPGEADIAILNSCCVTTQAVSDSRQKIHAMARRGAGQIVVTGCWASLEPQTVLAQIGVKAVVSNQDKDNLVNTILEDIPALDQPIYPQSVNRSIPGPRSRTRAFVKVQDGCNNHCTFCITRLARGAARSRPLQHILTEIDDAQVNGVQEVVLCGVNIGSWGYDFEPSLGISSLHQLVENILLHSSIPRLRISSIEPWDITADFLSLWQDSRLCPHLHIPLQSGCDATLRRMGRRTDCNAYASLVEQIRSRYPDMAITTDIIVGFPGENEMDFQSSLVYVERINFAGGHVFPFSERPGTPAWNLPGKIPHISRKSRSGDMRTLLRKCTQVYKEKFLYSTRNVLWEKAQKKTSSEDAWLMSGLTDNYIRVYALSHDNLWNSITPTLIISLCEDGVDGKI